MINNEFRLIGTITSRFLQIDHENEKYIANIEVETKYGKPMNCKITVSKKNYLVDVEKSLVGKQVIVNGYIDFNAGGGLNLIVQNLMVVGKNE